MGMSNGAVLPRKEVGHVVLGQCRSGHAKIFSMSWLSRMIDHNVRSALLSELFEHVMHSKLSDLFNNNCFETNVKPIYGRRMLELST